MEVHEIQVGDIVLITRPGQCYDCYDEFYATYGQGRRNWTYQAGCHHITEHVKVVAIAPHLVGNDRDLAIIEHTNPDGSKADFIICLSGLTFISREGDSKLKDVGGF